MNDNTPEPTFTQSPNILNDCIQRFIDPHEFGILDVIVRKTYGFHKSQDEISNSQIEFMTGFTRPTVTKFTRKLEWRKLVTILRRPGRPPLYQFGPRFQLISDAYMKRMLVKRKARHGNGVSPLPGNGVSTTPKHGFPLPGNGVSTQKKVNKPIKKISSPDGERSMTEYHDDELKKAVTYIHKETGVKLAITKHVKIWWYNAIREDDLNTLKFMIKNFCHNEANRKIQKWDWISFFKYQAKRANFAVTDIRVRQHAEPDDDGVPEEERQRHREAAGV